MDRELIFIVAFGIMGLALFGGMYLGDGKPSTASASTVVHERPAYSKDDIRYKFQQEEAKQNKHKPKKPVAETKDQFVTDGSTSARKDEGSGSDEQNEEDKPVEEPPLD